MSPSTKKKPLKGLRLSFFIDPALSFLERAHITKQERQVFLFLSAAIFSGLLLCLAGKGRWEHVAAFRVIDDPSFYPRVNINKATLEELVAVPYVGPVTARMIVDSRPFSVLEDLRKLPGIGEGRFRKIEKYLRVK